MAPAAVRVTSGELIGRDEDGLCVFRGVPYAQPPLGKLRFAPPQPVEPWSGTRDAFEFGPVSVQALNPHMQQTLAMGPEPVSEDCLTLNVWTPGLDDGRRPVLCFIHGGGFTLGAGSQPVYDGASLARRGDPSGGALAEWPQFDARSRRTMLLDRECRVVERPRAEERAAMESVVR